MGQFLARLDRPKLWDGYPFLLSAAIGDIEDSIKIVLKGYNSAGALQATNESTAASYINSVVDFNLNEVYGSLSGIKYITAYLETDLGEVLTDTMTIDVIEPCANPVYLVGRNSLGGVLSWMFDLNQDKFDDYGNQEKAGRLVLTSVGTTINQWNALSDFITLGEVYKNNIVEFTSETIKTSTRIGQQVYDVDSDGNKIGIIVIPIKNKTRTKQLKHIFELEIEYPETFTA